MASEWVKILAALYKCAKEIGFICQTSVGDKLTSPQAKVMGSNFSHRVGMNTRASILQCRLIRWFSHCRRNGLTIIVSKLWGRFSFMKAECGNVSSWL